MTHRALLRWGIKESLRSYVEASPDGRVCTRQGARLVAGTAEFPLDRATRRSNGAQDLFFSGALELSAHGGLLNISILAPLVRVLDSSATVWIRRSSLHSGHSEYLLIDESPVSCPDFGTWVIGHPRLSVNAVTLFDGVYPAGTLFDPLVIEHAESVDEVAGNGPRPGLDI